ncbi:MAG: putative manganese-dependent inorganic diphosphatase [Bacilli bacterium]|nr:putative manganese-dependent inorganic diphosphatase [Bacilli bacterium]
MKTFVFGHRNPDTDSVCGAISLSYLKNKLGFNTEARILSDINKETKFALEYFNFSIPKYLNDVKVKIKDITYHKDYMINEDASIYKTYHFMNLNNITGIPLIDNNKKFVGYVSLKEIAHSMINDSTSFLDTNFDNIKDTLKSEIYYKASDEIKGNIIFASFEDNTFINKVTLNSDSILIVGDRQNIIEYAIEKKVKLIILIGNFSLDDSTYLNAKNNGVNIICTPYRSFETCKLLGLSNRINTIKRAENCICLDINDYMSDFIDISNKTKHTNYPIVSKNGVCHGMLRLIDINDYIKTRVILVDHNDKSQSVVGLDEAEIVEVVDHHNISDIITSMPINFRNMAVGSVNTIIYFLFNENNVSIPNDIAGLMISGILSDTMVLNSPTTTYMDRFVVMDLAKQIGMDYKDYGMKLLKSGMSLEGETIESIIYRDYKAYTVLDKKFAIGQVLSLDFKEFELNIDDYVKALDKISENNNYIMTSLFVTDILNNNSYIIYSTKSENLIKDAFNLDSIYQGIKINGILSRKQQILPNIIRAIDKI